MSKSIRKLVTGIVAAVMALFVAVPAFAQTITITPPEGTPSDATNTYHVYKVFDATTDGSAISYKVMSGKDGVPTVTYPQNYNDTENVFILDDAGNVYLGTTSETETQGTIAIQVNGKTVYLAQQEEDLNEYEIAAIASYVEGDTAVADPTSTGTGSAVTSDLTPGYYYVTTSTGTAVMVNSAKSGSTTVPVQDKGSVSDVDKEITGVSDGSLDDDGQKALAQVGTTVDYQSTITVAANTKNLKFQDVPGSGLSLDTGSLKVQVDNTDVATDNYEATITTTGINISFNDTYIASLDANTEIVISYSATITSDALFEDTANGKNTASITYGDNSAKVTSDTIPEVYNAKITVTKTNGNKDALPGAGFVLSKVVNGKTVYYKYTPATNTASAKVEFVELGTKNDGSAKTVAEAIADGTITELKTTDDSNVLTFAGLVDGTYTLTESTVPSGYNKAADSTFAVKKGTYTPTNLQQSKTVVNNSGATLPTTGGMGTTIFTVVGATLVVAAGALLVTRKRMEK